MTAPDDGPHDGDDCSKGGMMAPASLVEGAVGVLRCPDPAGKVALSHAVAAAWASGTLPVGERIIPPDRPARPDRPPLLHPRDMPRRRAGGAAASRIALLHAVAHIELNAIDLAWDLVARFESPGLGFHPGFYDDWVRVADEEASHHGLLAARLAEYDAAYGDLPAHDGLWQAAEATAHDLLARLAVVPLVLEARGLDVTLPMIESLGRAGDHASADVLRIVYQDEIGHVEIGRRWFERVCQQRSLAPITAWQDLVRRHYRGLLKQPFNKSARMAAGFDPAFYEPLAEKA
jgi:uncharacterized ferritin-like protein (DUF455 family)